MLEPPLHTRGSPFPSGQRGVTSTILGAYGIQPSAVPLLWILLALSRHSWLLASILCKSIANQLSSLEKRFLQKDATTDDNELSLTIALVFGARSIMHDVTICRAVRLEPATSILMQDFVWALVIILMIAFLTRGW